MVQAGGYQGRRSDRRRLAPHSAPPPRSAGAAPGSLGAAPHRAADQFGLTQVLAVPYGLYGPGGVVVCVLKSAARPGSQKVTDVLLCDP